MPRSGDGGGFLLQLTGNGITAVAAGYKGLLFPSSSWRCSVRPTVRKEEK
ncbi:fibronectin leucine rich transmembrane protein 3 (predicted), isoform CRA_a [Rattus norvegicus]|uniref:Fibronectin leucine rich transmembrane protein 3 (Predicted), isoform CRA_a n=1 Tax=Rattus norvegicus TaxID=10116 RepID=A6HQM6_RAT|nr:fibronectin leucine rich transmembrane protein 3 (predicted), isoform CRA_a [Rattus norvegicus]